MSSSNTEDFKWANKPTWYKLTPSLVVAKWVINGKDYWTTINPNVTNHTYGWTYEGN